MTEFIFSPGLDPGGDGVPEPERWPMVDMVYDRIRWYAMKIGI